MKLKTLSFLVIFLFAIAACNDQPADNTDEGAIDETPTETGSGFEGISEKQCKDAGGSWNECGSPCAGTDAEVCIQMCRTQCECGGIAGFSCPQGYNCKLSGKIVDEMGVCVKK